MRRIPISTAQMLKLEYTNFYLELKSTSKYSILAYYVCFM